jgi:hypothetical protein
LKVFFFVLFLSFSFFKGVPNLKEIHLNHSLHLTDQLVGFLVEKCPHIEVLDLWNCLSLTDAGFF